MLPANDKTLMAMTAALAHEIKNPAALALAHVSLLRSGTADLTQSCDHITQALEAITDLVQEMLSLSFGEPTAFAFDIQEVITDILEMYQSALPGVRFSFAPRFAPIVIHAPEMFVRIVLSNLLKNATEATDGHTLPETTVFCGVKDGWMYLIVRDNGPGYDKNFPFGPLKKPHGNGMGLPIVRFLLSRMGGYLKFHHSLKGGCEAVVRLPLNFCVQRLL